MPVGRLDQHHAPRRQHVGGNERPLAQPVAQVPAGECGDGARPQLRDLAGCDDEPAGAPMEIGQVSHLPDGFRERAQGLGREELGHRGPGATLSIGEAQHWFRRLPERRQKRLLDLRGVQCRDGVDPPGVQRRRRALRRRPGQANRRPRPGDDARQRERAAARAHGEPRARLELGAAQERPRLESPVETAKYPRAGRVGAERQREAGGDEEHSALRVLVREVTEPSERRFVLLDVGEGRWTRRPRQFAGSEVEHGAQALVEIGERPVPDGRSGAGVETGCEQHEAGDAARDA